MLTYPIMAREHDMVRSEASIPERVSTSYEIDIVLNCLFQRQPMIGGIFVIYEVNHGHYTEGKEVNTCFVGVCSPEARRFQFVNEISLHRIDASARTIVKNRLFPFFVDEHFEELFHLKVAPENYYIY